MEHPLHPQQPRMVPFGFVIKNQAAISYVPSDKATRKQTCIKKPYSLSKPQTWNNPNGLVMANLQNLHRWKSPEDQPWTTILRMFGQARSVPLLGMRWRSAIKEANVSSFLCMYSKIKKECKNKGRLFFCCPNGCKHSCQYFEWVPKTKPANKSFRTTTSFCGPTNF